MINSTSSPKTATRILLAATTLLAFASCKQPEIPEYQAFENFTISKIGMKESVVSADLKYYNPNDYPLQLKRANLAIAINNKPVGNTTLDTLITIPKKDTFYVPVKMKVDIKQLLSNALTLLMNDEIDVKVNGTIRLGRSGFFINMPVNYAGKQKLEW
jgi:LEA14-like dessication related protein